jgi:hypothetical protein
LQFRRGLIGIEDQFPPTYADGGRCIHEKEGFVESLEWKYMRLPQVAGDLHGFGEERFARKTLDAERRGSVTISEKRKVERAL